MTIPAYRACVTEHPDPMNTNDIDTSIPALGEAKIQSPIQRGKYGSRSRNFIGEKERVLINVDAA
jgi:hypothetical protein